MENKLNKEQLQNILGMLQMKHSILSSCVNDYTIQIDQVKKAIAELEESKA